MRSFQPCRQGRGSVYYDLSIVSNLRQQALREKPGRFLQTRGIATAVEPASASLSLTNCHDECRSWRFQHDSRVSCNIWLSSLFGELQRWQRWLATGILASASNVTQESDTDASASLAAFCAWVEDLLRQHQWVLH